MSIHHSGTTCTPLRVVRIPRRGRPRVRGVPHPYIVHCSPRTLPRYDLHSTRTLPEPATRAGYRCPACSECNNLTPHHLPSSPLFTITFHHFLLLTIAFRCFLSLSVTFCHFPLLSVTFCCFLSLSVTFCHFLSLSVIYTGSLDHVKLEH